MRERHLVRHFVRGFIDNDLISPDTDRHEVLSVVCAALITLGLFVSVLRSMKFPSVDGPRTRAEFEIGL